MTGQGAASLGPKTSDAAGPGKVILVDDEPHLRNAGKQALELAGFEVACFESADGVLDRISRRWPGVLVTDIKMPRTDGLTLMHRVLELDSDLPVVLVTGHGDVAMAVQAMRDGAYDFIEKPFASSQLVDVAGRALEKRQLVLENRALQSELDARQGLEAVLVGRSPSIEKLRQEVQAMAEVDADILIVGETGTGKELVARALHDHGRRAGAPFVAINCGALPETIIESELFGHDAGAFTGASKRRIGKFEHANGGTVFLDEIESMPQDLQVKLLRVIQERTVERLGSNETAELDLRFVAASKSDLKRASAEGRFREDLYYRLNVVTLTVPPLRARLDDLALLFQHFLRLAAARYRREAPLVPPETLAELLAHGWPGNVRELRHAADRFALGLGHAIETMPGPGGNGAQAGALLSQKVEAFEKSLIVQELTRQQGNMTATCAALGLPRKTLYDKMKKHRLCRDDFAPNEGG